jgi:diguanylate cyclase (GGDEF)-like protein
LVAIGFVGALGLIAAGLAHSQGTGRQGLASRFETRGAVGARFVETFARQLLDRETLLAARRLGGHTPDPTRFSDLVDAFGFQAAVLLDSSGRVLHITPENPAVVGQPIADRYDHLASALRGTSVVSNVVPSAAQSVPVVAFAASFDGVDGRRVFSGAYEISSTPLGGFLRDAVPITPHRVYLVDSNGMVVASDPPLPGGTQSLRDADRGLASILGRRRAGEYRAPEGNSYYFSAHAVNQTAWTLVIGAPASVLFAPVSGNAKLVPWLILLLLGGVGAAALGLLVRFVEGRRELADLYLELEFISRTDPVTGLYNRRHLEEHLRLVAHGAQRHQHPLSVLTVDIDNFKTVNDRFGHDGGDVVLRVVAERMRADLRADDVIGRWGGEEFVVVLPMTPVGGAVIAAERLRAAVAASSVSLGPAGTVDVTVSVGCASATGGDVADLLRESDGALYRAKTAGRNRVIAAEATGS